MNQPSCFQDFIDRLVPRFRYGVILPGTGGVQRGVDYQFYRLVPADVMQIGVGLGIRDYSAANVQQSAMNAFWTCVETLEHEGAQRIMLSGVPVSAGLGRQRIRELIDEVPNRTNIPFDATLEAVVAALHFLGTPSIAIASRFPDETNQRIAGYLTEGGIQVVGMTSRDMSLAQAQQLSMQAGMALALEVGREAALAHPAAQAIFLPGGATLNLHAIPALETEFEKPVVTNLSAEIWHALIQPGVAPQVADWGRLLASPVEP